MAIAFPTGVGEPGRWRGAREGLAAAGGGAPDR
jgi:hypothetical protein